MLRCENRRKTAGISAKGSGLAVKSILEFIEDTVCRFPDRTAVADEKDAYTYRELLHTAGRIGSYIGKSMAANNLPVAIYMGKTPKCVAAMLGVLYSGNFYVVLDDSMPAERVNRIFETLHPQAVLTDKMHEEAAGSFAFDGELLLWENASTEKADPVLLSGIRHEMTAGDPAYVLYTSGSTGQPKGTVISHQALIAYSDWVIYTFNFDENTVFGSQTPFYFSMSVTDLFGALRTGARLQIIPKEKFSFPLLLIEYMNQYRINTIYWVPSALCIVANWDTFAYAKPEFLETVLFAGEVMPNKQLNYWRKHFPDAFYANLFGPTETTDICTYYVVNREFRDEEVLPIGRPCDNCQILIVDENDRAAEQGELLVKGPFLAEGYYNNPVKTGEVFVQNPLNHAYPERVYRTGDLVTYNDYGELIYLGRKDFQIKHMGYRIELGEIEANISAAEGVQACACLYDSAKERLVAIYQGRAKEAAVMEEAKKRLPVYMHPNVLIRVKNMPHNANGKIDRNYLKHHYEELQRR